MERFPQIINGAEVPYEKDISELKSMLKKEMTYYAIACIALAYKSDIDSLNLLAEYLSDKDWCRRRMAIEALGYHARGYLQADKLINLLSDESRYVIKAALEAIRKEAIACLRSISREDDIKQIIQLFVEEKSKLVKDEAAWFIRQKSDKNNWIISVSLLKESNLARHKVWACELIGIYGDKEDIELLNRFKGDKDGHVRKAACNAADKLK